MTWWEYALGRAASGLLECGIVLAVLFIIIVVLWIQHLRDKWRGG